MKGMANKYCTIQECNIDGFSVLAPCCWECDLRGSCRDACINLPEKCGCWTLRNKIVVDDREVFKGGAYF